MSFIAVIDYKMGNLLSVSKALEASGAQVKIVTSPAEASDASGLVLPGVGNFGEAMVHLNESGWIPCIRKWIAEDKPFLGICLGMQMLLESSEEAPGVPGIGIFKGSVKRFPAGIEKVPHMDWNSVRITPGNKFLSGLPEDPYFYFVHSYYASPEDPSVVAAVSDYILDFAAALSRGNLIATQFHPEKSQNNGLHILHKFIETTIQRQGDIRP